MVIFNPQSNRFYLFVIGYDQVPPGVDLRFDQNKVHSAYSATSRVIGIVVGFCMQQRL